MAAVIDSCAGVSGTMHCLMMQGKLSRHTLDDAIQFARDNGIHRPEAIIRAVANALMQFRTIAMKHGVQPRWINVVEQTSATSQIGI